MKCINARVLSLAHIDPKCLGGKSCTLLCRYCNSLIGSEIESHLIKKIEWDAAMAMNGSNSLKAHFEVERNGELADKLVARATFSMEDNRPKLHLQLVEKASKKQSAEKVLPMLSGAGVKVRFSVTSNFVERKAQKAHVSIAYHRMFHRLGYEFAFSPLSDIMRFYMQASKNNDDFALTAWPQSDGLQAEDIIVARKDNCLPFFIVKTYSDHLGNQLGIVLPPLYHDDGLKFMSEGEVAFEINPLAQQHEFLAYPDSSSALSRYLYNRSVTVTLALSREA